MQNKIYKISYVFSFRNEEQNILELITRVENIQKKIPSTTFELIFVNDNSTDNSEKIIKNLKKNYLIKLINMSRQFGVQPCVLAGFKYANGDAIIYMDSDLQDPPEIIPEMFKKFLEGNDVIHTIRKKRKGENPFKLFITKLGYKIINFFSSFRLPENSGDFKLLSKRVVNEILKLNEHDPYIRSLPIWIGFKQSFVEYDREPRFAGNSKFPILHFSHINEMIRGITSYSAKPLYFSFIIGLVSALIAAILIIYSIFIKLYGLSNPGVSSILITISFFSGLILMTIGIMGIYLEKIFFDVKKRPQYIIKEIINIDSSEVEN